MNVVRFSTPAILLLLVLLPIAVALARRRIAPTGVVVLRLLVLGSILLALASPQVTGIGGRSSVIFAVDFSDSIPPDERLKAVTFVRAASSHRRSGEHIGAVTFGADAIVEEAPSQTPRLAFTSTPDGEATDLAGAIRTALSALPPQGGRRIVMLTDGNANRGDLAQALAVARSQDVEISVVPLVPREDGEVLVEDVFAPQEVRVGERFALRVAVQATDRAQVHLRVLEGDAIVDERTLAVEVGRTVISVPRLARTEGVLKYTVSMTASPDSTTANNRAEALVAVRGTPVVWYVADAPGILRRTLAVQGMRVHTLLPETLPSLAAEYVNTMAVVLDNVSATRLSPAQMAALRDYVGHLGGGLVVVGGVSSFGVGGYAGTALEEVLPVTMDVRHRLAIPSMAIILVVDTSGSMGSFGQQIAKVELAKETAQSVIDLLGERDVIGVVAFDQEPRWLVQPTEARLREQVMDQVSRVQAGGGTDMHPAIALAFRYLRTSQAKVRHVIVLSDGQTDPGEFQGLVTRMAREKMTLSSVAIGSDADLQIMQNLAQWGGGRYYFARDLYTIPQIFTAEALLASRAYIVEERFTPQVAQDGLVDGFAFPPLRGYIATAPKPAGVVHLLSSQDDPILAAWQYGVGQAIAFTSDASPRWAAEWMSWPRLAPFWGRLIRWVMRDDAPGLQVMTERRDGTATMTVDAYAATGDPVDGMQVLASVVGPRMQETVPLVQSGPGRYEGRIEAAARGTYTVTVVAKDEAGRTRTRTAGFIVPYSPELRDLTVNRGILLQITEATAGRVLDDPKAAMRPGRATREIADAWPLLVSAAMGLLVVEIAVRRMPVIGHHLAVLAGILSRTRRQPSPQEIEEDRHYAEADRWKFLEEPTPTESMEQAARLYIARLKAMQHDEEHKEA